MSEAPVTLSDEREFRAIVGNTLKELITQLDEIDTDDMDARVTEGNLTVSFDSGGTFIVSQQTPTRELWLSANLRAWHFRLAGDRWIERDTDEPLTAVLGGLFSNKLKLAVHFTL